MGRTARMGGMDDDGDLAVLPDLLEHSIGTGPWELPTPAQRLAEGRKVLRRRRRIGLAATSAAVAAAIGVGVTLSGPGGRGGADGPRLPVATSGASPTPGSRTTPTSPPRSDLRITLEQLSQRLHQQAHRKEQRLVSDQFPASFGPDGKIVVKDGWRITQQVEEPLGYQAPEASLGVVVTDGERTRWMLLTHQRAEDSQGHQLPGGFGDSASADDPGKGYSRFEDWLASMVELQGGTRTPPLVTVGADDTLRAGPGATLVETAPAPEIDGYTAAGDRMAQVRRDGRTWFVVVRGHGARADVIPVDAEVLAAPTFEAFVDHLTAQAASGEGVR